MRESKRLPRRTWLMALLALMSFTMLAAEPGSGPGIVWQIKPEETFTGARVIEILDEVIAEGVEAAEEAFDDGYKEGLVEAAPTLKAETERADKAERTLKIIKNVAPWAAVTLLAGGILVGVTLRGK